MRARVILGITFGIGVAAVAACASSGSRTPKPGKKNMDIVIWLDSQCVPTKTDPAIAYDDYSVTWRIYGDCKTDDTLTFTPENGLTDSCDKNACTAKLSDGKAKLTVHITKGISGPYSYTLAGAVVHLDPILEIDP